MTGGWESGIGIVGVKRLIELGWLGIQEGWTGRGEWQRTIRFQGLDFRVENCEMASDGRDTLS